MLTGAPIIRHTFVGLGVVSLVVIQFSPGTFIRQSLGLLAMTSGIHLFWGVTAALQLAQVERHIGSGIVLSRFAFGSILTSALHYLGVSLSIPSTLLFLLAPTFIALVPPQKKIKIVHSITLSEKWLQYYLFYQLAQFDANSAIVGTVLGLLMFQWNQEFITFEPEIEVTDPIGATREIQRKQELDRQEELFTRQQMARFAAMQQQPVRRTVPQPLRRRPQAPPPPPAYTPSDEDVASLVAMGFDMDKVKRALTQHRGNLTGAAEQLIRDN